MFDLGSWSCFPGSDTEYYRKGVETWKHSFTNRNQAPAASTRTKCNELEKSERLPKSTQRR